MATRHNPPIRWTCPVCGIRVNVRVLPVHCACGYAQYEYPAGLGDRVAAAMAKVGITKQRYMRAKRRIGLKGDCNCPKRQRRGNKIGHHLGIGR